MASPAKVTRVAREVGTEAGSAASPGARRRRHLEDLTDNVNSMAGNLTARFANIAEGSPPRSPMANLFRANHCRCSREILELKEP